MLNPAAMAGFFVGEGSCRGAKLRSCAAGAVFCVINAGDRQASHDWPQRHSTVRAGIPCHFPARAHAVTLTSAPKPRCENGLSGKFPGIPDPFPACRAKSLDSGQNCQIQSLKEKNSLSNSLGQGIVIIAVRYKTGSSGRVFIRVNPSNPCASVWCFWCCSYFLELESA